MRDHELLDWSDEEDAQIASPDVSLRNSLWVFDGNEFKVWLDTEGVLRATSEAAPELPSTVSIPLDFYPLSTLLGKGIILGVEADLTQRRDLSLSLFRFSIRVSSPCCRSGMTRLLMLPDSLVPARLPAVSAL